MSFMFHPYPYADPNAVNKINVPESVRGDLTKGIQNVAKIIAKLLEKHQKIGIDAYPGAEYETLINILRQILAGQNVAFVDASCTFLDPEEIEAIVAPYLPEDREADPVLLYGRRYREGYRGIQNSERLERLKNTVANADKIIVYGKSALSEDLQNIYDIRIWIDVTPRTAVLNCKNGKNRNIGCTKNLRTIL